MFIPVTPLSRRPWWLWLLPLLPGAGLAQLLADALHGSELSVAAQCGWVAWLLFCVAAFCWSAATLAVTDYDADYLYRFTRRGTERLALASV